jgi:hypothetical protein
VPSSINKVGADVPLTVVVLVLTGGYVFTWMAIGEAGPTVDDSVTPPPSVANKAFTPLLLFGLLWTLRISQKRLWSHTSSLPTQMLSIEVSGVEPTASQREISTMISTHRQTSRQLNSVDEQKNDGVFW